MSLTEQRPEATPSGRAIRGTGAPFELIQRGAAAAAGWGKWGSTYDGIGRPIAPIVLALAVLSVPLWQSGGFQIDRFAVSLLYVAGALGLNTLFGYAGEFSFAPGLIMGVSAYMSGILCVHAGLPMVASMALAILGGIVGSLLLHLSGLRVRGWYFALTSFFALLVFPNVVDLVPKLTGGDEGLSGLPTLRPFDSPGSDAWSYEIIAVAVIVLVGSFRFLLRKRSKIRLIFLTLHHSPRACAAVGISTVRVKLLAYVLAGVPLGVAGVLLAHLQGSVSYSSFGLSFAIALFAGVILGRPGNFWGPLLGVAGVYGISLWIGPFSSYNPLVLAGAIMVVALTLPHGRTALRHPRARSPVNDPAFYPGADLNVDGSADDRAALGVPGDGAAPIGATLASPLNSPGTAPFTTAGDDVESTAVLVTSSGVTSRGGLDKASDIADHPTPSGVASGDDYLVVEGICKAFGGQAVLSGVNLSIAQGEIVGLLGANGSGKTTLLNVMSGLVRPEAGEVRLLGRQLLGMSPTAISRAGLARTFQVPEVVEVLTVRENIEIAIFGGSIFGRRKLDSGLSRLFGADLSTTAPRDVAGRVAEWLGLRAAIVDRRCGELSLGVRRLVEIARAVAFGATLMCLDEPAAGLNPEDAHLVALALRQFSSQSGCAMLVVEHNPAFILGLSDRVLLLEEGEVVDEYRGRGEPMSAKLQSFLGLEDVTVAGS